MQYCSFFVSCFFLVKTLWQVGNVLLSFVMMLKKKKKIPYISEFHNCFCFSDLRMSFLTPKTIDEQLHIFCEVDNDRITTNLSHLNLGPLSGHVMFRQIKQRITQRELLFIKKAKGTFFDLAFLLLLLLLFCECCYDYCRNNIIMSLFLAALLGFL